MKNIVIRIRKKQRVHDEKNELIAATGGYNYFGQFSEFSKGRILNFTGKNLFLVPEIEETLEDTPLEQQASSGGRQLDESEIKIIAKRLTEYLDTPTYLNSKFYNFIKDE